MKVVRVIQSPLFLLFLLIASTMIWLQIAVIPYASVLWDEAVFLTRVYEITHSIRSLDVQTFLTASYQQLQYAPIQSWVLGVLLVPFDFTVRSARTVNLVWLAAAAFAMYALGSLTAKHILKHAAPARAVGLFSAALFLLSPLVLYLSSVALKEIMASAMSIAAVYTYILAARNRRWQTFLISGCLLLFLFMAKYQYGVFMALGIMLETAITMVIEKKSLQIIANHLLMSIPGILFALLWFVYPINRLAPFLSFLFNNGISYTGGMAGAAAYALFYVRAVVYYYCATPAIGIALFGLSFATLTHLRDRAIRILWLEFTITAFLLTGHTANVQERYLIAVIPFLFILSAVGAAILFRKFSASAVPTRAIAVCCLAAFVGVSVLVLPYQVYAVGSLTLKGLAFPQRDYNDAWFNYDQRTWPRADPVTAKETPQRIMNFIFSAIDATKPVTMVGALNEVSPPYLELARIIARDHGESPADRRYSRYTVTVAVDPSSPYYTQDYRRINAWHEYEIPVAASDPGNTLITTKTFSDMGITIGVYGSN